MGMQDQGQHHEHMQQAAGDCKQLPSGQVSLENVLVMASGIPIPQSGGLAADLIVYMAGAVAWVRALSRKHFGPASILAQPVAAGEEPPA